ncbi:MAG: prephenate dehydrogenase [Pseudomonadota bacterium]
MTKSLSIIGVGAFGEFMLRHVTPYFDVHVYDEFRDLSGLAKTYNVTCCGLEMAATCDILVIAVPVRAIEGVVQRIVDHLRPGQLVMDVASVKCLPAQILLEHLPQTVDIVGLHPLFGPQSGKTGIHGQNIAVVDIRSSSIDRLTSFLTERLGLNVISCTADEHDEQMAYVQGLTHMIARVFQKMDMPTISQETKTFSLLRQMVNIVKDDSDALFKAIQTDNPFVDTTKQKFFDAVTQLQNELGKGHQLLDCQKR